jgi:hypothetical protein
MNDDIKHLAKEELLQLGLKFLEEALLHVKVIKDCPYAPALAHAISNSVIFGKAIYDEYKK